MKCQSLAILSAILLFTGCTSIGPKQMDLDRGRYNDVVFDTDNAQMLKNIVRMRYNEPISFLKVTNVTSSYSLTSSLAASQALPNYSYTDSSGVTTTVTPGSPTSQVFNKMKDITWTWGLVPSISYADSPTLSYVPINDSVLVKELLKPINFDQVSLLFHGGIYNYSLLIRMLFYSIGSFENNFIMIDPNSKFLSEDYEKYHSFVKAIAKLHEEREIRIESIIYEQKQGILIHFFNNDQPSEDAQHFKEMLKLPQNTQDIVFTTVGAVSPAIKKESIIVIDPVKEADNVMLVKFRSVMGVMSFLSHAVEVPEVDVLSGCAKFEVDANGNYFDWSPLLNDIIKIHSSKVEPRDAFVKTKFHNHWFYIKSTDHYSKMTFTILMELMTLTSGLTTTQQVSPVLTIPVR